MDSQQFAQDYPWISYASAVAIAADHGLDDEVVDEILIGNEIETRQRQTVLHGKDVQEVNTASLLGWLGY